VPVDAALGSEDYCYVTTTGRITGKPHEIEIWFALQGDTIYILAGGRERSDWVKNAKKQPRVTVRIAGQSFAGVARIIKPTDADDPPARRLLLEKYAKSNDDLDDWGRTALPVAIDLTGP
jgi:deazaflavin-dependent oxidoreductase (nitroreductase family)